MGKAPQADSTTVGEGDGSADGLSGAALSDSVMVWTGDGGSDGDGDGDGEGLGEADGVGDWVGVGDGLG
ncbi:hypothetical protein ACFQ06_12910, partial [Tessaracoccus lubricantis]